MSAVKAYLAKKFPYLTDAQIAAIMQTDCQHYDEFADDTAALCLDNYFEKDENTHLVRKVPSAAIAQEYLEQKWKDDHASPYLPPDVKLQIAREIAGVADDPDSMLSMVPPDVQKAITDKAAAKPSAALRSPGANDPAAADKWIKETFGVEAATMLPSKRRALLEARDKQPDARRRDAAVVDELSAKSEDKLSAQQRMSLHRAQNALKKRA